MYKKNCPICNKIMEYTRNYTLTISIKENWKCRDCCPRKKSILTPEEAKKRKKEQNKISNKKYRNKNKNKEKKRIYDKKYKQKPKIKLHYKIYFQQEDIKKKKNIYMKKYIQHPKVQKRIKKYRKENNQILREKKRIYTNNKRKNPITRLSHNFSTNLRESLKRYSKRGYVSKNGKHWENLVGYTVQKLKKHLESLFLPGITWDNYGEWHIDHIIPKSFFIYSSLNNTEFKYCWSLNNLQPLWAKDNIRKKAYIKIKNPLQPKS